MAHAACATHKTDCSRTYDTMAVQLSLERCGVVLLDRSRSEKFHHITEKKAANVFADLYQEQSTTHVARELIKEVREETENIILSSYGEERDCSMTDPFSMKELKDVLKKVKTKKAPGPDGITVEMLKHHGACSRAVLLKIFNGSWMRGVVPAV